MGVHALPEVIVFEHCELLVLDETPHRLLFEDEILAIIEVAEDGGFENEEPAGNSAPCGLWLFVELTCNPVCSRNEFTESPRWPNACNCRAHRKLEGSPMPSR